ncbi:dihydrolipoamide acetyltransferase family protein [Photobacterium profundum]|uniref:Dihydrolipoamide acetyltransferase component of pyruvate dehydrogenase complex n=1 Tax=Photobacterium profundum 3TCK TaxID=314280 RepID=Q1Z6J1_9GAMM|nr:dihydrolipoamide acetyltransferase family protein [Photobacterium profundum]EAS44156.1 dihydrolipoamide acetyltransferase [Photobacterium profundum 3TCK]
MKSFMLPDLGEGLAESEIVEWHIKSGDVVKVDQIVLTVETAKATVDIPAPYSGKIISRYGKEGDVINIGSLLLEIEEVGATAQSTISTTAAKKEDAATVVGNVSHQNHHVDIDDFWVGSDQNTTSENIITAMPSARLLAQRLGVDLHGIIGSGPDGLIVDADIYNECDKQLPGTEVLKGARRTMVNTMAESHHNVAAVTITEEALLADWLANEDISIRLIQAVINACQQEPALNAWFDAETMTRCVHSTVNIGIAVDSAHGLYVPVLRHADEYSPKGVRQWLDKTVKGIRDRRIGREQLQHATITLSNFGAIAGIYATPVVSPPQVAIVGAGRIIEKVIIKDGQPIAVKAMPLSMTFDHRACTGGEAARFIKALVEHLQQATA